VTVTNEKLKVVQRAAKRKRDADEAFRSALAEAVAAGCTYSETARAAGTSRQRVRQLLLYRAP
jgi:predicted aldo/keto reductase-like oxidoreductase